MSNLLIFFMLFCLYTRTAQANSKFSELRQSLFKEYDQLVIPDDPVTVNFYLNLENIDVDPKDQMMITKVWLQMNWVDSRLKWNPDDFNGVTLLVIPPSTIWIPDIVPYNGEHLIKSFATTKDDIPNVIINSSGKVIYVAPVTQKTSCSLNFIDWPWGVQNCTMVFGSWMYPKSLVDIVPDQDNPIRTPAFVNSQIELLSTSFVHSEKQFACCPESYPTLALTISFKPTSLFMNGELITP